MPLYRATVWTLSAMAEAVEGDAAISRQIVELETSSKRMFEATIRDWYIHDVDNGVWFGPITDKTAMLRGEY